MGPEFVFGVGMLFFTLRASSLPQRSLFMCFGRLKQPVENYSSNGASNWHLNAKSTSFWHKSKYLKKFKGDYFND